MQEPKPFEEESSLDSDQSEDADVEAIPPSPSRGEERSPYPPTQPGGEAAGGQNAKARRLSPA